ncbi:hypothetical protein [Sorangium sp. So ce854]|uniref:hypothetical protein n=1 Tax=Sorangium sp. So ce854 TaxID=3133322 RepID=UPI003F5E13AA
MKLLCVTAVAVRRRVVAFRFSRLVAGIARGRDPLKLVRGGRCRGHGGQLT